MTKRQGRTINWTYS